MAKTSSSSLWPWLGIAALIILFDQFTKVLVIGAFELGHSQPVTSFFNLVRVHNTGAAFSFLAHAGGWQRWFFVGLGAVATGFIVYMLRQHGGQKLFAWALTLILGGAIGNVIDRQVHGHVVDFIQWYVGSYTWPSFNIADSAIVVGAIGIALFGLFDGKSAKKADNANPKP